MSARWSHAWVAMCNCVSVEELIHRVMYKPPTKEPSSIQITKAENMKINTGDNDALFWLYPLLMNGCAL
eukprot:6644245-Karenia_brevis.AAC.1